MGFRPKGREAFFLLAEAYCLCTYLYIRMVGFVTINSIDLQVLIPRATDVGKSQQVINQQDTVQQQQFAGQWKEIADHRQHQVQGTPKSEGGKVGREKQAKEHENPNEQKKQDKSRNAEADKVNRASNEDPVRGHVIDIKT